MITLSNVRDWLKGFDLFDNFYVGKLDNKKDKSLGIYPYKRNEPPTFAIGGNENQTYNIMGVSLLIHYNNNASDTELTARRLYEYLRTVSDVVINNRIIYMLELLEPEPVFVDTDDKGVYEYVIEFKIYYERKK